MTAPAVSGERWSPSDTRTDATVLEYSAASHVGLVRSVNEDSFLAGPPVFVVADGMGGHDRGDVAAALVVESFAPLVGSVTVEPTDLDRCIERSRQEILRLASGDESPGSTVIVAAYVVQSGHGYWLLAHEGDSRAYLWRAGSLESVTRDHSIVQELVDAGEISDEEARTHPERHVITRAIGALADSKPEFSLVPVEPGARLLLCSDGLTGELSEASIGRILGETRGSAQAVQQLLRAAVDAGGHDNVTALVVDVVSVGEGVRVDTLGSDAPREDTVRIARRKST